MKIIDLGEIYNFLVLSFFYLKSLRYSKKLMTYLDLRVFLTFYTSSLTTLEPNLTAVARRAKNFWSSGAEVHRAFSVARREL